MIYLLSTVIAILVCAIAYLAMRQVAQAKTGQMDQGFKLLQETVANMERSLLLSQKEFEKMHELKSTTLRTELSENLRLQRQEVQTVLTHGTQSMDQKVHQLDQKLDQRLNDLTKNVGAKLELNIKEGFTHFEKIQTHLKNAEIQLLNLNTVGQSINDLNNLLKLPHLRGGFGEALLEKILTDLLPQDSFELQFRIVPNSTERVDAVIKYPTSVLPIDSKFPREQVLPLFETNDPEKLEVARKNLSDVIKIQAKQIRDKYIHPEHGTTEMALLFVPSETLYFEILRNIKLCEELAKMKVFAVSPNTLSVTVHAIALSRNYYEMAKGVEKTITEIKKAQQHFKNFDGRFQELGNALTRAQTAFGTATTHLARYQSAVTRLTGIETVELEVTVPTEALGKPLPALES